MHGHNTSWVSCGVYRCEVGSSFFGSCGLWVGHPGIGPVPVHLADVQNLEFKGCNQALCCVPQDIPDTRCLAVAKAPVIEEFHCNVWSAAVFKLAVCVKEHLHEFHSPRFLSTLELNEKVLKVLTILPDQIPV